MYSGSRSVTDIKYYGLFNQGATSYLNSVLQVLFMTKDFREAVQRHSCDVQTLDRSLKTLFDELRKRTADTSDIIKKLDIRSVDEGDAAECFENILNRVNIPEASELFQGRLTYKYKCATCGTETSNDDSFWSLCLEMVEPWRDYKVVDEMNKFFTESDVRGSNQLYCDHCAAKSDATMKTEMSHHSEVLTLQLRRAKFDRNLGKYVKITCGVQIPPTLQIPHGGEQSPMYELYAFVEHIGSLRYGYYNVTIKSQDDGKWHKFSDSVVMPFQVDVNYSPIRSWDACLLFYRKISKTSTLTQDISAASTSEASKNNLRDKTEQHGHNAMTTEIKEVSRKHAADDIDTNKQSRSSAGIKYYGLSKKGETSYLNSVLQVLFMTKDFREAVQRQSCDVQSLDRYLKTLFDKLRNDSADTSDIIKKLGIRSVDDQGDAAECFEKLLSSVSSPEASQLFQGLLTLKYKCSACGTKTNTDFTFWSLPLELQESFREYSVVDEMNKFFTEPDVRGPIQLCCDHSAAKSDATMKVEMKHLPEVLTLQLNKVKFDHNQRKYVKISCNVQIPPSLQMSHGGDQNQMYELYAFVEHIDFTTYGYHTVTIKSQDDGKWYKFNETTVTLCSYPPFQVDVNLRSCDACLLFYRKIPETRTLIQGISEASTSEAYKQHSRDNKEQNEPSVKTRENMVREAAAMNYYSGYRQETVDNRVVNVRKDQDRVTAGEMQKNGEKKPNQNKTQAGSLMIGDRCSNHIQNGQEVGGNTANTLTQDISEASTSEASKNNLRDKTEQHGHNTMTTEKKEVSRKHAADDIDTNKQSRSSAGIKYYGLSKKGETSYLNSVLQVLFMTKDFREAVQRHSCDVQSLDRYLKTLFDKLRKQSADTSDIIKKLDIRSVYVEGDAAECFETILSNMSSPEAAQLFQIQLTHKYKCSRCGQETNTDLPLWSILLELERSNRDYDVVAEVNRFFTESDVRGLNQLSCDHCGANDATMKVEMKHHPEVLTLQLKKQMFNHHYGKSAKITCSVQIPPTLQIPHGGDQSQMYELYAFVEYIDLTTCGYHTVTIKSPDDGKWYKFGDTNVTMRSNQPFQADVCLRSLDACLLFYRKVSATDTSTQDGSDSTTSEAGKQGTRGKVEQHDYDAKTRERKEGKDNAPVRLYSVDRPKSDQSKRAEGDCGGGTSKQRKDEEFKTYQSRTDGQEIIENRVVNVGEAQSGQNQTDKEKTVNQNKTPAGNLKISDLCNYQMLSSERGCEGTANSYTQHISAVSTSKASKNDFREKTKQHGHDAKTTERKEGKEADDISINKQSRSSTGIQYYGLSKKGETSYLNSVLQVLFMTKDFREAVQRHSCDVQSLDRYLKTLFDELRKRSADTSEMIKKLDMRSGYDEGDAAECFETILSNMSSSEAAQLFQIQLTHKYKCSRCGKETNTDLPFWSILLELERSNRDYDVVAEVNRFFTESDVRGLNQLSCDHCGANDATMRVEMKHHPEVLTLQLKKQMFYHHNGKSVKITCSVQIPPTLQIPHGGDQSQMYELYAFVEYIDLTTRGYHTVTIKSPDDGKWYKFGDTSVTMRSNQPFQADTCLRSLDACLLFYRKVSATDTSTQDRSDSSTSEAGKQGTRGKMEQHDYDVKTTEIKEGKEADKISINKQSRSSTGIKYYGLSKKGEMGYLNSVLQVLFMTKDFREAVQRHSCDVQSLDRSLKTLFDELRKRSADTSEIIKKLDMRSGYDEGDAAECFETILSNMSSSEAAQLFQIQLTHKYKCSRCCKETNTDLPFWSLPLEMEESNRDYDVMNEVEKFFTESDVSESNWLLCDQCDAKPKKTVVDKVKNVIKRWNPLSKSCTVDKQQKLEMKHHPAYLMLHLKRFKSDQMYKDVIKISRYVDIPHIQISQSGAQSQKYELYAFVEHVGGLRYGYYTVKIRSQDDGKWYTFRDDTVTLLSHQPFQQDINHRSRDAYLLFYRKISTPDTSGACNQDTRGKKDLDEKTRGKNKDDETAAGKQKSENKGALYDRRDKNRETSVEKQKDIKYHGLLNQGATCYLNSVLQVLFMTRAFREAVKSHSCDAQSLDAHLNSLFEDLKKNYAYTYNITKKLGITRVNVQSDAAACLENILSSVSSPEASQLFQGTLTHKYKCSSCGTETSTDNPVWSLPLEFEESFNGYSVVDGVRKYFSELDVSGTNQLYCDKCTTKSDATLKAEMKHHPDVLTLLMKRFKFDYNQMTFVKIDGYVQIPYKLEIPHNGDQSQAYELYAYVEHFGDLRFGHYTSTIKSQENDKWYHFNDTSVTELPYKLFQLDPTERSPGAYLLFYRKNISENSTSEASEQESKDEHQQHDHHEKEDKGIAAKDNEKKQDDDKTREENQDGGSSMKEQRGDMLAAQNRNETHASAHVQNNQSEGEIDHNTSETDQKHKLVVRDGSHKHERQREKDKDVRKNKIGDADHSSGKSMTDDGYDNGANLGAGQQNRHDVKDQSSERKCTFLYEEINGEEEVKYFMTKKGCQQIRGAHGNQQNKEEDKRDTDGKTACEGLNGRDGEGNKNNKNVQTRRNLESHCGGSEMDQETEQLHDQHGQVAIHPGTTDDSHQSVIIVMLTQKTAKQDDADTECDTNADDVAVLTSGLENLNLNDLSVAQEDGDKKVTGQTENDASVENMTQASTEIQIVEDEPEGSAQTGVCAAITTAFF